MKPKLSESSILQKSILNDSTLSTNRYDMTLSIDKIVTKQLIEYDTLNLEDSLTQFQYVSTANNHIQLVERLIEQGKQCNKQLRRQIFDLKQQMRILEYQSQKDIARVLYEFDNEAKQKKKQFEQEYQVQLGENVILQGQLGRVSNEIQELDIEIQQCVRHLQQLEPDVGQYQMFRLQPEQ